LITKEVACIEHNSLGYESGEKHVFMFKCSSLLLFSK